MLGRVVSFAAARHGVVTTEQLRELGLSRGAIGRLVASGWLARVYCGVYGVGCLTPESHRLAAVLACGPGAVLSHRSAGRQWGVLRSATATIEVTAGRGCRPRAGFVLHTARSLAAADRAVVDGIPVTSVARTLLDLASVLSDGRLADALERAELLGVFDLRALDELIERQPARKGVARLRRVLALERPGPAFTRSEVERLARQAFHDVGLSSPQVNHWTGTEEVDFVWPEHGLVVEIDGRPFHSSRRAMDRDRRRDRRLAAEGLRVVRFMAAEVYRDARAVAGEVLTIMAGMRGGRSRR